MELADAIQSEQHVKKELARRMGELQEELHNTREQVRSHTHSMTNTIGGLLMNFCVGEFVGFCPFSLFHCAILSSLIFFLYLSALCIVQP